MIELDVVTPRAVRPFPDVSAASQAYKERQAAARIARVAAMLALPAARMPREAVLNLQSPFVGQGQRTVVKRAANNGWEVKLYRAVGPRIDAAGKVAEEQCATLTVAAQSPAGRRLVWEWRWLPAKGEWKFVDVIDGRTGEIMTSNEAKDIVTSQGR